MLVSFSSEFYLLIIYWESTKQFCWNTLIWKDFTATGYVTYQDKSKNSKSLQVASKQYLQRNYVPDVPLCILHSSQKNSNHVWCNNYSENKSIIMLLLRAIKLNFYISHFYPWNSRHLAYCPHFTHTTLRCSYFLKAIEHAIDWPWDTAQTLQSYQMVGNKTRYPGFFPSFDFHLCLHMFWSASFSIARLQILAFQEHNWFVLWNCPASCKTEQLHVQNRSQPQFAPERSVSPCPPQVPLESIFWKIRWKITWKHETLACLLLAG